jgi:hypothetical protein
VLEDHTRDFEAPGLKEGSQFREPCRMFWVNERS